jgi:FlaA1/EpsC-like NDP-sugar epimerase
MRRSRVLFVVSLVLTDAAMSLLAFFIAYLIRLWARGSEIGRSDYMLLAGIQLVNTLVVFFFFKFYHRRHAALLMDEVYRLFGAVSVATLLTIAFVSFVFRDTLQIQRLMLLLAWAVGIIALTLGRIAHGRVQRALQHRGIGAERVLIIGTGEVGRMIVQKIQHTPGLGYRVAGFVEASSTGDTSPGAQVMGLPVFGTVENLPRTIEVTGSMR